MVFGAVSDTIAVCIVVVRICTIGIFTAVGDTIAVAVGSSPHSIQGYVARVAGCLYRTAGIVRICAVGIFIAVGKPVAVAVFRCPDCTRSVVACVADGLYRAAGIIRIGIIGIFIAIAHTIAVAVGSSPDRIGRIVGRNYQTVANNTTTAATIRIAGIQRGRILIVRAAVAVCIAVVRICTCRKFFTVQQAVAVAVGCQPGCIGSYITRITSRLHRIASIQRIRAVLVFGAVVYTIAVSISQQRIGTQLGFRSVVQAIIIAIQRNNQLIINSRAIPCRIIRCESECNDTGRNVSSTRCIRSDQCIGISKSTCTISCPRSTAGRTPDGGRQRNCQHSRTASNLLVDTSIDRSCLANSNNHLIGHRHTRACRIIGCQREGYCSSRNIRCTWRVDSR